MYQNIFVVIIMAITLAVVINLALYKKKKARYLGIGCLLVFISYIILLKTTKPKEILSIDLIIGYYWTVFSILSVPLYFTFKEEIIRYSSFPKDILYKIIMANALIRVFSLTITNGKSFIEYVVMVVIKILELIGATMLEYCDMLTVSYVTDNSAESINQKFMIFVIVWYPFFVYTGKNLLEPHFGEYGLYDEERKDVFKFIIVLMILFVPLINMFVVSCIYGAGSTRYSY